jgi:hypothetical protein
MKLAASGAASATFLNSPIGATASDLASVVSQEGNRQGFTSDTNLTQEVIDLFSNNRKAFEPYIVPAKNLIDPNFVFPADWVDVRPSSNNNLDYSIHYGSEPFVVLSRKEYPFRHEKTNPPESVEIKLYIFAPKHNHIGYDLGIPTDRDLPHKPKVFLSDSINGGLISDPNLDGIADRADSIGLDSRVGNHYTFSTRGVIHKLE